MIVFVLLSLSLSFASAADVDAIEVDCNSSILHMNDNSLSLVENEMNHGSISSIDNNNDLSHKNEMNNNHISSDETNDLSSNNDTINKSLSKRALSDSDISEIPYIDYEFQSDDDEVPDVPDLVSNSTIYINSKNFNSYFEDNILKPCFGGNLFVFSEDFENLGKLSIQAENVTISSFSNTLKNTVFELGASNIILSNLNLELDSEYPDNEYAGVLVYFDNATLRNLNINYVVPENVQAYGIYADGMEYGPINNLQIINCTINFEGHNDNAKVYNHALKLESCINATVENNTLMSSLPLKDINFGANGAQLASDLVLTVGIEQCDYLRFVGNNIVSQVNKRPQAHFPSLDSVFISQSSNSLIANNSISLTDFVTYTGVDNYLYGLDIYNLENLTVTGNNISVRTTGGKLAAGTAYPIQVTGPIDNVNITYNDLFSFSNGPNIGIYSQNYYGATALRIMYNHINVTGLAGKEDWALVAGIESQDTNSIITDNIIEVHSVENVTKDDNLYGVSYLQSTEGDHKYNISQNTVFSDGYYSVNLLSSVNSSVADNLLVSYNPNAKGSNGFKYGDLSSHEGIEFYNNSVVSAFDYFARRENIIDNGEAYDYNPTIGSNISNDIDASGIFNGKSDGKHSYNPLIPGSNDNWGIHSGEDGWTIPKDEDSKKEESSNPQPNDDDESSDNGLSLNQLLANYIKSNGNSTSGEFSWEDIFSDDDKRGDGAKANVTVIDGTDADEAMNDSDQSPSDSGPDLSVSQSDASSGSVGDAGAVAKKAYKIDQIKDIEKKSSLLPIVLIALALICLLVGYKRKKSFFE